MNPHHFIRFRQPWNLSLPVLSPPPSGPDEPSPPVISRHLSSASVIARHRLSGSRERQTSQAKHRTSLPTNSPTLLLFSKRTIHQSSQELLQPATKFRWRIARPRARLQSRLPLALRCRRGWQQAAQVRSQNRASLLGCPRSGRGGTMDGGAGPVGVRGLRGRWCR